MIRRIAVTAIPATAAKPLLYRPARPAKVGPQTHPVMHNKLRTRDHVFAPLRGDYQTSVLKPQPQ